MMGTSGTDTAFAAKTIAPANEKHVQELAAVMATRRRYFQLVALRRLGNMDDAEDVVQDAFLSAWRHLSQFRGHARMATWLTTIVINSTRMKLRRKRPEAHVTFDHDHDGEGTFTLLDVLPDHRPGPEDICRAEELSALYTQCSRKLTPGLRRAHQLRELEGLSIRDTAKILGIAHGTVKAQTSRARAKIRHLMREGNHRKRRAV
jgi:RNA polymerase sigma-70 factor, ECF subfamily